VSYQHTDFSDDFTATAFDADPDTVLAGADFSPWENTVAGVAFGYDSTDTDTAFNGGSADLDSFSVVPYFAMSISEQVGVDYDLSFDVKAGFSNSAKQRDSDLECSNRAGCSARPVAGAPQPSAVTGSITLRTSVTFVAGKPLRSACSRISASLSAR